MLFVLAVQINCKISIFNWLWAYMGLAKSGQFAGVARIMQILRAF